MNRTAPKLVGLLVGLIITNVSLMASAQGPTGIDWEYQIVHQRGVEAVTWDVWQEPVADIGPAGTDEGKGGRYLFLPPGYEGETPDGFFPVPMDTYSIFVALRCIPLGDASFGEASEYSKKIRA